MEAQGLLPALARAALIFSLSVYGSQATAQSAACLPSCDTTDAKLLNLSGSGQEKLSNDAIELSFIVNPGVDSFTFGVFDGDTGGLWDDGSLQMDYVLYADPTFDGTAMTTIATFSGADMANNAWTDVDVTVDDVARHPGGSGYRFYRLIVRNPDRFVSGISNSFKVRTSNVDDAWVILQPQLFAIEPVFSSEELFIIFPDFPDLSTRTYDGAPIFHLDVHEPFSVDPVTGEAGSFFAAWDGDLDFGAFDCDLAYDSNDPNTPDTILPPWAAGSTVNAEGVAITGVACANGTSGPNGEPFTTGDPPDDISSGGIELSPSVNYHVIAPDGQVFVNDNPSGNEEWELFRIGAGDEPVPSVADANALDGLPVGIWRIEVTGLDLSNHSAFRFLNDYVCVTDALIACPPSPVLDTEPPAGECACEGKVVRLVLEYTGERVNADVYVTSKHDRGLIHSGILSGGDSIVLDGTGQSFDNQGTLGPEINIYINGERVARIHTSCSQPIGPGMTFGDFRVIEGHSRTGGTLCPLPEEAQQTESGGNEASNGNASSKERGHGKGKNNGKGNDKKHDSYDQ